MARRRNRSAIEDLIYAPWWISLIVLIGGNVFIRMIIPAWFSGKNTPGQVGTILSGSVAQAMPAVATMFSLVVGFALILSGGRAIRDKLRETNNNR